MVQTDLRTAGALAKRLGVRVRPSTTKHKKLDVLRGNRKIASIGHLDYEDFLTHRDPERRRRYKVRHGKTRGRVGSPSYYADQILWPTDRALRAARGRR
mgnify:CR=1 FL=1